MRKFLYVRDLLHKLWREFKKGDKREVISNLNEDIIIDILCKLPMESLLVCKLVCPQWCSLISSEEFAKIHVDRGVKSITTIVFFESIVEGNRKTSIFFVDDLGKKSKLLRVGVSQLPVNDNLTLLSSCNGMLLLFAYCYKNYMLYNPMSEEGITLKLPVGYISDLFWDELNQEYQILLYRREDENFHYFTYGLRSKRERQVGIFRVRPCQSSLSVRLPKTICWLVCGEQNIFGQPKYLPICSECIMVFEMDTERLYVIGHPGICPLYDGETSRAAHLAFNLFVMEDKLVFSRVYSWRMREIWVLEDLVNVFWVKRQVIDLHEEFRHFYVTDLPRNVQLLNIVHGELLVMWSTGLFWYNLRSKRVYKICNRPDVRGLWSLHDAVALTHMRTFVSPKSTLT